MVALIYGAWATICVLLTAFDLGDAVDGQLLLIVSGFPLALLSLDVVPNGSVLATLSAGVLGCLQWFLVVEANTRFNAWKQTATR